MGSLTKADMAERLSSEQKLSKRDAKEMVEAFFEEVSSSLSTMNRLSYLALAILIYAISAPDLDAIPKQVKKWLFQPVVW